MQRYDFVMARRVTLPPDLVPAAVLALRSPAVDDDTLESAMAAPHTAALSHEQLVVALERRFDYQSARSVAGELLAVAGVAKADAYDAGASAKLRAAAEASLTRAHAVLEALTATAPSAPAAPAKPASAEPAPVAAAEPAVETAPAAADHADKKKKA